MLFAAAVAGAMFGCGEPEAESGKGQSEDKTAEKYQDTQKQNRSGMGSSPTTSE
jgi:hypothetical protein